MGELSGKYMGRETLDQLDALAAILSSQGNQS
jgi:hypothetical protein